LERWSFELLKPILGNEFSFRRRASIPILARMSAILWTIIIGAVIGVVAKFLMPGRDPGGCIITILLGIAGSFLAAFLGRVLGWYDEGQPAGFIFSVIGAMILLLLYRVIFVKRS
jgi:uncharacterized membrane protein YeaQ/YmgE (transglycosylase-associated protein family)